MLRSKLTSISYYRYNLDEVIDVGAYDASNHLVYPI